MSKDRLYLVHIQECIGYIEEYISDGEDWFLSDKKTQDAVLRNLHVMAESTQRLSDELKAGHSNVDWRRIGAFRNVIVHDYLGVDVRQIWDIVTQDLSELKSVIETILSELE